VVYYRALFDDLLDVKNPATTAPPGEVVHS
jgi:hypothetical protein